jgi:hypothetical protein
VPTGGSLSFEGISAYWGISAIGGKVPSANRGFHRVILVSSIKMLLLWPLCDRTTFNYLRIPYVFEIPHGIIAYRHTSRPVFGGIIRNLRSLTVQHTVFPANQNTSGPVPLGFTIDGVSP